MDISFDLGIDELDVEDISLDSTVVEDLNAIGLKTDLLENDYKINVSGDAEEVGVITLPIEIVDTDENVYDRYVTVRIDPIEDSTDSLTDNEEDCRIEVTNEDSDGLVEFKLTIPTDLDEETAEKANNYKNKHKGRFKISGNFAGNVAIESAEFQTTNTKNETQRRALGTVNLVITGKTENINDAQLTKVNYVAGGKRYSQEVNLKLSEVPFTSDGDNNNDGDNTNDGNDGNNTNDGDNTNSGGCDTGVMTILPLLTGLTLLVVGKHRKN
jgi:hypothetical protein